MSAVRIELLGQNALLLRLEQRIDSDLNAWVHALADTIAAMSPPWLAELVPGYASLAVVLTPDSDHIRLFQARTWLTGLVHRHAPFPAQAHPPAPARDDQEPILDIPVLYGGEHGPDLAALAAHAGLDEAAIITRHGRPRYQVGMLGFAPGFPYLLGLDRQLAMPRLATPRQHVPAGSVGIGGAQTGIYPQAGPGGWRIIGRTPLTLFDPRRTTPSLLHPGQWLRFSAVDADTFMRIAATQTP